MLTLFAMPKPFLGHIGVIQRNAIRSWIRACSGCEIILFGSDEGTAEVASELGVRHVPDVASNDHGTPLVSDLFEQAQRVASYDLLAYVNADIILMSDFLQAIGNVSHQAERFLMVGQRWDVAIEQPWDFDAPNWEANIRSHVQKQGGLHPKTGIDYFVFPRGLYDTVPPFAIGRTAWDNWLIHYARRRSAIVVDATESVTAVHQDHDYGKFASKDRLWTGEEARLNQRLMGGAYSTLDHASHLLSPQGLRYAWTLGELLRHPRRLMGRYRLLRTPMRVTDTLLEVSRPIRSVLGLSRSARRMKRS